MIRGGQQCSNTSRNINCYPKRGNILEPDNLMGRVDLTVDCVTYRMSIQSALGTVSFLSNHFNYFFKFMLQFLYFHIIFSLIYHLNTTTNFTNTKITLHFTYIQFNLFLKLYKLQNDRIIIRYPSAILKSFYRKRIIYKLSREHLHGTINFE